MAKMRRSAARAFFDLVFRGLHRPLRGPLLNRPREPQFVLYFLQAIGKLSSWVLLYRRAACRSRATRDTIWRMYATELGAGGRRGRRRRGLRPVAPPVTTVTIER